MSQKISPIEFLKHLVDTVPENEIEEVVEAIMNEEHSSEHVFEDDPVFPGTCKVCHWINDETTASCHGKSARKHVQELLMISMLIPDIEITIINIGL